MTTKPPRPGEIELAQDPADREPDAGLVFIGRIRTPWQTPGECPRNGRASDALCTIELDPAFEQGLKSLDGCSHIYVLYWMHQARRDLIVQAPAFDDRTHGTFALRSPMRPNPISLSVANLVGLDGTQLKVRGIDCLDGTPLLDIKPYFGTTDAFPEATVGWHKDRSHPGRRSADMP